MEFSGKRHKKGKSKERKSKKCRLKRSKKRNKNYSSSSDSSSDSDSSSSSSSDEERYKQKYKKHKRKSRYEKKKHKKVKKHVEKVTESKVSNVSAENVLSDKEAGPSIEEARKWLAPMTKEEWEKQQSIIRRVYDPETGRNRLIKGDGEVLEEIVSKARHREINKMATRQDGEYFQKRMGLL